MSDERKGRLDLLAITLLVVCCALWGLNHVATKVTLAEIPPLMQAAAARSVGAALLLGEPVILRLVAALTTVAGGIALVNRA